MRKIKSGDALKGTAGSVPSTPTKATNGSPVKSTTSSAAKARPGANKKGIAGPVKKNGRKRAAESVSDTEDGDDDEVEDEQLKTVKKEAKEKRNREETVGRESSNKRIKVEEDIDGGEELA